MLFLFATSRSRAVPLSGVVSTIGCSPPLAGWHQGFMQHSMGMWKLCKNNDVQNAWNCGKTWDFESQLEGIHIYISYLYRYQRFPFFKKAMTNGLLIQPVSNLATNPTTCLPRWNLSFGPGKRIETVEVHWSVGLTRDWIQVNAAYVDMQSTDLKHELDASWCWRLLFQQTIDFIYLNQSICKCD